VGDLVAAAVRTEAGGRWAAGGVLGACGQAEVGRQRGARPGTWGALGRRRAGDVLPGGRRRFRGGGGGLGRGRRRRVRERVRESEVAMGEGGGGGVR
jgi:hypothetical protein